MFYLMVCGTHSQLFKESIDKWIMSEYIFNLHLYLFMEYYNVIGKNTINILCTSNVQGHLLTRHTTIWQQNTF